MNVNKTVQLPRAGKGMPKWFFVAALVCGLAMSSLFPAQAMAQSVVQFAATKSFNGEDVTLKAKLFRPEGAGRFPAVILMHGCGGWQPAVTFALQKHADNLVRHGFVVLSVDSFGPRHLGGGKLCESDRQLREALNYRAYDAFDALRYLQAQAFVDPDNVFLMGQSNGGSVAINAVKANAAETYNNGGSGFRGAVAYYPWCGSLGGSKVDLKAPLLVLGGGADNWTPTRSCENASSEGAELDVKVYPGAVHSFDLQIIKQSYYGKLIGYDKAAAQDSEIRMVNFFKSHLATRVAKAQ